jgi:MbtH protein
MFEDDTDRRYVVVRNDAEQYSVWPDDRAVPGGWYAQDFAGTKAECLAHIAEVWTDMRPKSLREHMDRR